MPERKRQKKDLLDFIFCLEKRERMSCFPSRFISALNDNEEFKASLHEMDIAADRDPEDLFRVPSGSLVSISFRPLIIFGTES